MERKRPVPLPPLFGEQSRPEAQCAVPTDSHHARGTGHPSGQRSLCAGDGVRPCLVGHVWLASLLTAGVFFPVGL